MSKLTDVSSHYDLRGKAALESVRPLLEVLNERKNDPIFTNTLANLDQTLPPADTSKTLLDLCCGTGFYSLRAAQLGYQVTGVDLSPVSIQAAQEWAKKSNLIANFDVYPAVEYLRSLNQNFDRIQCLASVYYFNPSELIKLMYSRLNKGGKIVIIETNGSNSIFNALRFIRVMIRKNRDRSSLENLITLKQFREIQQAYPNSKLTYFDFFSLFALPFKNSKLGRLVHRFGSQIDKVLFSTRVGQHFAFKMMLEISRP